jgi:SAM-dependent methyltransferase
MADSAWGHPWPPHLSWVVAPTDGPRRGLASDDEDVTCLYQWPAGAFLGTLPLMRDTCAGRRVADLGCGRGALGLGACAHGATRVLFADASPVAIDFLTRTLAANGLADRARAALHRWGTPLPDGPWEVILGGDILYRPECFTDLLDTIAASLTTDGVALLSDPRVRLEESLTGLAAERALTWETARIAHITVVSIRRRQRGQGAPSPGVVPSGSLPITPAHA